ncbi:DUF6083 domain-containing protein [Streptomyces chartreusis]|uniref:DUF6083 domain-containing protein n=1 Tax=Streptomyces chartreusis TaxID=1969 RepID=UPI0033C0E628
MCSTPTPAGRHWDGSPRITRRPRPLRVVGTSPSRLLRAGQSDRCRQCGNRTVLYQRADQRPIALHPTELATVQVPEPCRWHLTGGIAYPHGDGSPWCSIPHAVLCPRRTPLCRTGPYLEAIRRQLAVRTRRLTDTGAFTPAPDPTSSPADSGGNRTRPVVQMLLCRYLAEHPVEQLRCVAQTRHRSRCTHPLLAPTARAGTWRLLPTGAPCGQRTLPVALMAVYDLGHLPYSEQLRWRAQRCPKHAATLGTADLALTEWQPFDPLLHVPHTLSHPEPGHLRSR